ncbi:MAG: hypothetical protein RBR53_02945 [Desulforegulaceae bacterium]|nr:hypothetical protein [Desulforegulaceae bacterium]
MVNIKTIYTKSEPLAKKVIEELALKDGFELTFSKINGFSSGEEQIKEGDSQTVCLFLFLELRKHEMSKGWLWARGIKKISEKESIFHSWLEYDGFVVDPLPGFEISGKKYLPGDILITKKDKYRSFSGFKPMSLKNEKQVLRWIEKINNKYSNPA